MLLQKSRNSIRSDIPFLWKSRNLEKASVLISSTALVLVHVLRLHILLLVPAHHVAHHVAHHPASLLVALVALHVALLDHVASLLLPPAVHLLPLHVAPLLVHPPALLVVHAPALHILHPVVHAAPLPHHALLHALLLHLPAPMVAAKTAVMSTGH